MRTWPICRRRGKTTFYPLRTAQCAYRDARKTKIPQQQRTAFIVPDGTGITAEMLAHSLLTQFENIGFQQVTIPFVDSSGAAKAYAGSIPPANQSRKLPQPSRRNSNLTARCTSQTHGAARYCDSLCLCCSKRHIAAAAAILRDSVNPAIGILTFKPDASCAAWDNPPPSLPNIQMTGPRRFAS